DALENLREEQAELEPVDRPAEMGDRVTFDHIEIVLLKEDTDEDDDEDEDEDEEAGEDDEAEDDAGEDTDEDEDEADDEDEDEHDHSHGDDEDVERVILHQHNWDRVLRDDERDLF